MGGEPEALHAEFDENKVCGIVNWWEKRCVLITTPSRFKVTYLYAPTRVLCRMGNDDERERKERKVFIDLTVTKMCISQFGERKARCRLWRFR